MPIPLLLILGLHMAATLFWLLTSLVLGFGGNPGASKRMFRSQMVAATLAVFSGGGLWSMLHPAGFRPQEMVLAAGAVLAIAAAGVQGALVGGQVRRMPDPAAEAKVVRGQKIAAVLLVLALACMMAARHV
ncbi:MAG: hypothetical protein ACXU82_11720 [Caulobacteraceae bacterium]